MVVSRASLRIHIPVAGNNDGWS